MEESRLNLASRLNWTMREEKGRKSRRGAAAQESGVAKRAELYMDQVGGGGV